MTSRSQNPESLIEAPSFRPYGSRETQKAWRTSGKAGKQCNERSDDLGLFNLKGRDQRNDLIITQCKKKKKSQKQNKQKTTNNHFFSPSETDNKVFFTVLPMPVFLF